MKLGKQISWNNLLSHGSVFSFKYSTRDAEGYIADYWRSCAKNKIYLVELPETDVVTISIETFFEKNLVD